MSEQEKINLQQEVQKKIRQEKFKRKINFLQQVLCNNQTIKAAAELSKINFATAKVVLKKFRKFGFLKNCDKDHEKQIEFLRQIACLRSDIKQKKMQKRDEEFKKLCEKIKSIQPQNQKKELQSTKDIGSQIKNFQEELHYQKKIQYELVTSVLLEQIKLMKSQQRVN
ncbi:unnamed protein product [Paramecium sonneborni]|uniref:Uncharacterized protein n=1 Tax=Paramecium sonneborni TaxID=65129 RepID=A0A8S1Q3C4_9CILI|nr:unnamed protein product [Paramecium sonneborni]CAD8109415.1 unnamed protein product [Paramecium sonneborni]